MFRKRVGFKCLSGKCHVVYLETQQFLVSNIQNQGSRSSRDLREGCRVPGMRPSLSATRGRAQVARLRTHTAVWTLMITIITSRTGQPRDRARGASYSRARLPVRYGMEYGMVNFDKKYGTALQYGIIQVRKTLQNSEPHRATGLKQVILRFFLFHFLPISAW